MRCYDKKNDESNLRSYKDDVLDIAYHSRIEENYFVSTLMRV